jgi:formylglycine-generating enzyme required for sulfatase activity
MAVTGASSRFAGFHVDHSRLLLRDGYADLPVVAVTHAAAAEFCSSIAARLPTAAEWEWAARGPSKRRYSWGNALFGCHRALSARDQGLSCGDNPIGPGSVADALQDETDTGVTGLAGNVAEWVSDRAPATWINPGTQCERALCFIVRGGDWSSAPWTTRAASLRAVPEQTPPDWLGFRCAKDSP